MRIFVFAILLSCLQLYGAARPKPDPSGFKNPREIPVLGYSANIQEPFLKFADGKTYLFFNSGESLQEGSKDLHYAILETICSNLQPLCFNYKSPIGPNTLTYVEGSPTVNDLGDFYFIDTSPRASNTLISYGTFNPLTNSLTWIGQLIGLPSIINSPTSKELNMDIEVSPNGSTFYFSRTVFPVVNGAMVRPVFSDIHLAHRFTHAGLAYFYYGESAQIMSNINTSANLEYAPTISRNELEIFFVRVSPSNLGIRSQIFRGTRNTTSDSFQNIEVVQATDDSTFVEAPTLSPDGHSLYYHKYVNGMARLFAVER